MRTSFIVCLVASSILHADALPRGDVNGSHLVPYTNSWRLSFVKAGAPKEAATVTDELIWIEKDGRKLMKRTQITKYDTVKFESRNENVFDPETMSPVSMDFWKNGEHVNHREFDGRFVVFTRRGDRSRLSSIPRRFSTSSAACTDCS